jgi:hypothetical protein
MDGELSRFVGDLFGRITGPMMFRLILQPTMATLMAIRDGVRDARQGRPPYFWALTHDAEHRREWLQKGWKSIAKIFILAFVLDVVYQWIQLRWFYPGEALVVAVLLAIVPYLLVRGPVNMLARSWRRPAQAPRP